MAVADDQLDARKAAPCEAGQKDPPGGLVLARERVHAEDLAIALRVHRAGHDAGGSHDTSVLAHLDCQGVEPQVGVRAGIEGPGTEGRHFLV